VGDEQIAAGRGAVREAAQHPGQRLGAQVGDEAVDECRPVREALLEGVHAPADLEQGGPVGGQGPVEGGLLGPEPSVRAGERSGARRPGRGGGGEGEGGEGERRSPAGALSGTSVHSCLVSVATGTGSRGLSYPWSMDDDSASLVRRWEALPAQ